MTYVKSIWTSIAPIETTWCSERDTTSSNVHQMFYSQTWSLIIFELVCNIEFKLTNVIQFVTFEEWPLCCWQATGSVPRPGCLFDVQHRSRLLPRNEPNCGHHAHVHERRGRLLSPLSCLHHDYMLWILFPVVEQLTDVVFLCCQDAFWALSELLTDNKHAMHGGWLLFSRNLFF